MLVKSKKLRKWDDIGKFEKSGWLYRGQRSAKWSLETSFNRWRLRQGISSAHLRECEDKLIREFRRAYHQYDKRIPDKCDLMDWLALMQHYGAPTRLLDFTYSIYIAAYFATEFAEDDSAIWALNGQWAIDESISLLKAAGKENTDKMYKQFDEDCEEDVKHIFFKKPYVPSVYPINPFHLNQRLLIQQGTFLILGDITKSVVKNLEALPEPDDPKHIIKIVIPKAERHNILKQLWKMGISQRSLFPGLGGFAKSLSVYHPGYESYRVQREAYAEQND